MRIPKPMWWISMRAAIVGGSLPFLIYVTSKVPAASDFWWWHNLILYIWPSFPLMLGFAGPVDAQTILALILSAFLNAIIYAAAASLVYAAWKALRRKSSRG